MTPILPRRDGTSLSPTVDFMVRLKLIERNQHSVRDVLILWAVQREPGLMGLELARVLGYRTRSHVQARIGHLILFGLLEDRRKKLNSLTPNDLYITAAGEKFLREVVPV